MELLAKRMILACRSPRVPSFHVVSAFGLLRVLHATTRMPRSLPPASHYITLRHIMHLAPARRNVTTFSVMPAAWLMFCGRIPAALSSRNKDFVCRSRSSRVAYRATIHHLHFPFPFALANDPRIRPGEGSDATKHGPRNVNHDATNNH